MGAGWNGKPISLIALFVATAARTSGALAQGEQQQGDLPAIAAPTAFSEPQPASLAPPEAEESSQEAKPIVVTGSRLPRVGQQSFSPTQTVTPQDFILSGVGNVEQTLNQMPQIIPGFTNTSNFPGTGAATLDLRGLGSVRTLILVNGRRWIASDAGNVPEVDVSTIPASLIERVDIVTGGASAVYGSDAVTGVINFILNEDLKGLHLDARQSLTERRDGAATSVDLSYGNSFLGGRGKIVASVGWLDQKPVLQGDRDLSRIALQDGCAIPGTRDETGASTPVNDPDCAPPNVFAMIAGGSFIIPGSYLPYGIFFPTAGSDALILNEEGLRFDPDGQPRPLFSAFDLYNFAPTNYLQIGFRRWSANILASFELSDAITPYVEFSYIDTRSPQQQAPVPAHILSGSPTVPVVTINLDNPFLTPEARRVLDLNFGIDAQGNSGFLETPTGFSVNPAFGGDADGFVDVVELTSRLVGLGPRQLRNHRKAVRGLIGARGAIGSDWHYDLYYSRSHVEHVTAYRNSGSALRFQQALLAVRDPATGQITCLDPSNGCAPANVFGAGNLSAAAADFIRTNPVDTTIIKEQIAEGSLRRELPLFSAGPVGIAIGAAWRRNSYDFRPDPALFTGDDLGFLPSTPAAGSTHVWELFSEARVPMLADRKLIKELTAELGLRWSKYSSVGQAWTWKALGEWSPVGGLTFRGGFQRAVRAPNIRELFEEPSISGAGFFEPCSAKLGLINDPGVAAACARNGVPNGAALDFRGGTRTSHRGDPNLKAEIARTLTIGATLTPSWAPGLAVSIDYYDIRIRNPVGPFGGGVNPVLFGCIAGGGDPADPLCQAVFRDDRGFVRFIDQPTANMEKIRARGIDWQIGYGRRLPGHSADRPHRLDLQLSGTRYFENAVQGNANFPAIDCAGYFGLPCGNTISGTATPRWKVYDTVTWTWGAPSVTLRHRWFSSTFDGRILFFNTIGVPPFESLLPEEGRRYESRHYFDVAASFRLKRRFELTFGVNNLTDLKPAITGDNQVQANTDPSLYDVLGRRYFVSLQIGSK